MQLLCGNRNCGIQRLNRHTEKYSPLKKTFDLEVEKGNDSRLRTDRPRHSNIVGIMTLLSKIRVGHLTIFSDRCV